MSVMTDVATDAAARLARTLDRFERDLVVEIRRAGRRQLVAVSVIAMVLNTALVVAVAMIR